jgi:hypothetical protein
MNDESIEFAVRVGKYHQAGKTIKIITKLGEIAGTISGVALLGSTGPGGLINSFNMNGDLSNEIYVDTILSIEVLGIE